MDKLYSEHLKQAIYYSRGEAERLGNSEITPEHLLLSLLRITSASAMELLELLHVNIKLVKQSIEGDLRTDQTPQDITQSEAMQRVLALMKLEARALHDEVVDTRHMLLAILRLEDCLATKVLATQGVYYNALKNLITDNGTSSQVDTGLTERDSLSDKKSNDDEDSMANDFDDEDRDPILAVSARNKTKSRTPILDAFGKDITKLARENALDPVVGRDDEIERVVQILSRRKKNNPVLIGEPGVGKSAIVEGLALRIVNRQVSHVLYNKRLISLDIASIVAGTKYRGQFEERMKSIIGELCSNKNVVLFIDEIHTIVGAGNASGSLDIANMLKPALSRGEIQCIGATTLNEYRQSIEKDGALERRFQKIMVAPTTREETLTILETIKSYYESHHLVHYTPEALQACIDLTGRYITDRAFPDKAIDALDEVGSRMRIANVQVPAEIEQLETAIDDKMAEKQQAVEEQHYEQAAQCRDAIKQLKDQLEEAQKSWNEQLASKYTTVTEDDVAKTVSMMSGVPVQRIAESESARLLSMKNTLQQRVIGQDKAIESISRAIQLSRVGLKDPNKPIGTFMFLGPTGVGKTHLAKQLAEFMFGSADDLIRVDMSEFMEKFSVSRLIGAPPGYVGYDEGGQLTEKVRRKPYSIVLFDEIEKAHSDVFNMLLQVMDEGHITDSLGRKIDFKNTIIIMTSNVGTRQLKEFGHGVGFAQPSTNNDEYAHGVIQKALSKTFAPEFLNRIDEIIMFDQLSRESIFSIIDLELNKLYERTKHLGLTIDLSTKAKDFLAEKGYDVQFGARPLKRTVQHFIEEPLAEKILANEIKNGQTLNVELDETAQKLIFVQK